MGQGKKIGAVATLGAPRPKTKTGAVATLGAPRPKTKTGAVAPALFGAIQIAC
jgi:hypothetical protein